MTKLGSSRSCSKTMAAMLSCSPTENLAGTGYSGMWPSLIRAFAQNGGGRFGSNRPHTGDSHVVCEAEAVNSIQIADQTYVAASGARVGAAVADRSCWRRWWPDLRLQVVEDRAEKGIRWAVTGALAGTLEIWLEPSMDGGGLQLLL